MDEQTLTAEQRAAKSNSVKIPRLSVSPLSGLVTHGGCTITLASLISFSDASFNHTCTFLHLMNYRAVGGGISKEEREKEGEDKEWLHNVENEQ